MTIERKATYLYIFSEEWITTSSRGRRRLSRSPFMTASTLSSTVTGSGDGVEVIELASDELGEWEAVDSFLTAVVRNSSAVSIGFNIMVTLLRVGGGDSMDVPGRFADASI